MLVGLMAFLAVPAVTAANDVQTCLRQSGDESIAACSRAIAIASGTHDLTLLYSWRAGSWLGKGDYRRAIVDYSEAIRLDPRYPHAYNYRGLAYFQERDYDRALADYDEAIRLDPKYAHAYENRFALWSQRRDFGRAIADFDAASRLEPESRACAPEAGRVIACVRPSATDPAIRRFDSPHYVLFDDKSGPGANLLVFLQGTDGRPPGPLDFLRMAADAGYRVISLAANDVPAVAQYCPQRPDPDCSAKFRRMRIYGDGTGLDPAIDNTPAESIVNRLVKLLQYLDRREPQRNWGGYLENGAPKWSRIALAGQSQGAGMAAFIAQGHEVARVILFSSPWDFMVKGDREYLAPWLSAPSKTPPERWFAGYHEKEDTAPLIARAYALLRIPTDHVRVFRNHLPVSPQVAQSGNLYHFQGLYSPTYSRDRAFFLTGRE
jgi:tetratricopeptide (TPR) repeat protein